jgi:hypothetical protein
MVPIYEVQFDKNGSIFKTDQEAAVLNAIRTTQPMVTDVIVIAHGWNNDMDEARTLYRRFLQNVADILPSSSDRHVIALAVLWPSKKFADADLIPTGAASLVDDALADRILRDQLATLRNALAYTDADRKLDAMESMLPNLENDPAKQDEWVTLLAELLEFETKGIQEAPEDGPKPVGQGSQLLELLGRPVLDVSAPTAGDAGGAVGGIPDSERGGTAGFGDWVSGIKGGALRLLNFTTYYIMKERAGTVGANGVGPLLKRLQNQIGSGPKWHLVGHSFGGRLVTAATNTDERPKVDSLMLLQAAFSHNGFGENFAGSKKGFFRTVVTERRVAGPIIISHSILDRAVGLAYPIASRIAGENATALGDKNDLYGGIGRNGAQNTPESDEMELLAVGKPYTFRTDKVIFNLNADSVVRNHGDVARPETAYALVSAMLQ